MKKLILLLIFFFGLYPCIEKGLLVINGPEKVLAQDWGDEGGNNYSLYDLLSDHYGFDIVGFHFDNDGHVVFDLADGNNYNPEWDATVIGDLMNEIPEDIFPHDQLPDPEDFDNLDDFLEWLENVYDESSFVDPERTPVNIDKMLDCFNNVSNVNAHYNVKIYVDIPDNNDPNDMVEWLNPGHVFIRLEKVNGVEKVDQTFGFYPEKGSSSLTCNPVNSIVVNNGNSLSNSQHEYNASLLMNNISQSDFQTLINKVSSISSNNYDLNDYNCAHYALEIINSIRGTSLISEPMSWNMYVPPGSYIPIEFSASPGGLYKKLKSMKDNNDPEANNIEQGVVKKGTTSNGECN